MFSEHSPGLERALQAAQAWAQRLGASAVGPMHLLLGLVEEDEGRPATLLMRAGLDVAALRNEWTQSQRQVVEGESRSSAALDSQCKEILSRARSVVSALPDDATLTSEQVLIAYVAQNQLHRRALEEFGLSWERFEAETSRPAGFVPSDEPLQALEPLGEPDRTMAMDVARILDAGANRAREALRVVEDFCRFVLNDKFLSGELKNMRHELGGLLRQLPVSGLAARDTLHDVGATMSTPSEQTRHSLTHVAAANCKRLQEALRSLEEYAKLTGTAVGRRLESLRYHSYTLEKSILQGGQDRARLADVRLYILVSSSACSAALDWTIVEAAAGGAGMIQLREKTLADRPLLERARQVRNWTRQAGVLFIVNDRPDIARLADADGVHLGQDEIPVHEARRLLGPEAIIGVSTHSPEQVRQAVLDGASYIGVGPTFPSGTKQFPEFPGLALVRQATELTSLPAFVIGGVTLDNVELVVAAGGRRVAVGAAICQAEDPRAVAMRLDQTLAG